MSAFRSARLAVWLALSGIGVLAALAPRLVHAADTALEPYEEYGKHLRAAREVGPLSDNVFGDQVSLYNGATTFSVTDMSLPGNSALPVSLARSFAVNARRIDPGYIGGFGEWNIEIPSISGVFTQTNGWTLYGSTPHSRCTDNSDPPNMRVPGDSGFINVDPDKIWDGNQLHIPGMGDQTLYANTQPKSPAYATHGTYPWVTKDHWKISCLPSVTNLTGDPNLSGEGFIALSPSGVKYTFNYVVSNKAPTIKAESGEQTDTTVFADRVRVYLLATHVEDRFNNYVDYHYTGDQLTSITSNDGRSITLTWSGHTIVSATSALGTWYYRYGLDPNGLTTLTSVTRPDGSEWTYHIDSGSTATHPPTDQQWGPDNPMPLHHCQLTPYAHTGDFQYSVGAPSGASASFHFEYQRHYRSGVPLSCNDDDPDHAYPEVFTFFDNFTLVSKTISGVGLPAMTWSYDTGGVSGDERGVAPGYFSATVLYDPDTQLYLPGGSCGDSSVYSTTVTGPTSVSRYAFGDEYGCNEGKLYGTQVGYINSSNTFVPLKTTATVYVDESEAPGEPFPSVVGSDLLPNYVHPDSNRLRPSEGSEIVLDGTTFTSIVNSFDTFARATSISETGSASRTITTSYYDDLTNWVLGQTWSTSLVGSAVPCTSQNVATQSPGLTSCTIFDSGSDLPVQSYAFGKLRSTKVWNTDGTLASVADGDGNKTVLSNWKRGIPQMVTYADLTDQRAVVNDDGTIASVTDENGYTTSYDYDLMGRLSTITYPTDDSVNWNATTISFQQTDSNTKEYGIPGGHWKQTIKTGNGITYTYFDALWRPLVTETYDLANPGGTRSVTVKRYDAGGRTIYTSYPLSSLVSYSDGNAGTHTSYDTLDRVTQVLADSEQGVLTSTTKYLSGFQTKVTDPNGNATTTSYYTYGAPDTSLPKEIDSPEGESTLITRDIYGKPVWIKRNGTGYEFFIYDANQQLCKRSSMGIVTGYGYDNAGNLSWSASGLNENGGGTCDITSAVAGPHLVQRSYDKRNRLLSLDFSDSNGAQVWSYTPDGLPSSVTTFQGDGIGNVNNSYNYNKRRLLTGESLQVYGEFTWALGYGYDANGHLSVRYTPSGQDYSYMPDALGRPTQLYIPNVSTYVNSVSYFPDGNISSFVWRNGLTHTVTENARGLPYEIHDYAPGNEIEDLTYAYDKNGNPLQINDQINTGARTAKLAYDGLNRLTSAILAASGPTAISYHYNTLDQITQTAQGTHTRSFTYGSDPSVNRPDELFSVTDSQTGTTSYTYDSQGNLATRNGVTYSFDYGNRLRDVSGLESGYLYDGQGRRVQQNGASGGRINSFYNHTGRLMFQQTADGTTHDYLYLGGHLVAIRDYDTQGIARVMRYQHTDAEGSIIRQTDANANLIAGADYVYDAYGKQVSGSVHDGPGYTGHVQDASTGLTYMQQRYYDPDAMRFLSMDPVEANSAGGNLDRYWYANDNPYRYTDPGGRLSTRWWPSSAGYPGSRCGWPFPSPTCQAEPRYATGSQPSSAQQSRPAGQCDLPECDQYRQQRDDIVQEQHAAVHAASKEFAKQAGWMAINVIGGRVLGKVLGGISRFFGFASEDAGVAFRADTSHIFRNAPGHLAEDTAENRALLQGAVKPDNLFGTRGPGGSISVYQKTLSDGRQVWVEVRNGTEITNGGVNDVQQ